MSPAEISAIAAAAVSVIGAVAALVKVLRHQATPAQRAHPAPPPVRRPAGGKGAPGKG